MVKKLCGIGIKTMSNLNVYLDPDIQKCLNDLKKHYKISSKASVIRKGIKLLHLISEIEKRGGIISVNEEDGLNYEILVN